MPRPLRSASARLLVAIAASWAFSAWCSSAAEASCGDYLVHGPRSVIDPWQSADPAVAEPAPADGLPIKPPCRGPHCRSQQRTPAAPAPLVEIVVEQWASLLADLAHDGTAGRTLDMGTDAVLGIGSREPLTPPPRVR